MGKKSASGIIPFPGTQVPPPPAHLEQPERDLWSAFVSNYEFPDPGTLETLRSTLSAHMRFRRCRERIDAEGEAYQDDAGRVKAHPLLAAERDSRAAYIAGLRVLGLTAGGTAKIPGMSRA